MNDESLKICQGRITKKELGELYFQMLRIRLFEERIVDLYPEQEMKCPVHLCIGQSGGRMHPPQKRGLRLLEPQGPRPLPCQGL